MRTSVSLFLRLRATHWHFRWLPGSGSGTGLLPDLGALLPAAVLILTDDQDYRLGLSDEYDSRGAFHAMERTWSRLAEMLFKGYHTQ